ncbi:MAG: FAD-dependent oxidoreductase [Oscillospiraceae bacterium]|nr:FAD-dependent oxidoreductase [Oscillospiraceae bacterium]
MSDNLRPLSFEKLMGLLIEEHNATGSIFGVKDFYKAGRARLPIFGMRIENPVGPAAGPVTQTAQGIIAAYLSGARFFELKTVCPDNEKSEKPSTSIGDRTYSSEHPSELSVGEAFGEYVKAWYAIKLISTAFELGVPEGFVFNMSVGGSLEDLKSEKMNSFIEGLKSAEYTPVWRECENWARAHMDELDGVDNTYISDISPRVCASAVFVPNDGLSASEIEEAAAYLIEEKHLHTFVRVSPDLLGYYTIRGILDINGYDDIEISKEKMENGALYDDLKPVFLRLQNKADMNRLEFGVKVCDGLRIESAKETPIKDGRLTGRALFPIAFSLAEKIANDFGGGLRICFAGGADYYTASKLFNAGIWPVTVVSDIIRPGGLARFKQLADDVSKCDYTQFSGILTSDLPDIEKEVYAGGRYKNVSGAKAKKAEGPIPHINCTKAQCRAVCPLGADIPLVMRLIKNGRSLEALRVIFERNPMPFTVESLCSHPCVNGCSRRFYECPLDIRGENYKAAKNACFDLLDETQLKSRAGAKIAVVGCGPAGLSTACFLARQGAKVTIFDKEYRPGGSVTKYIPKFRIDDADIEWDATLIQALGIEMELGVEVTSLKELREQGFEKIVLAIGAGKQKHLKFAFGKSISALEFLENYKRKPEEAEETIMGNVVVIGGGHSAVAAARCAKKLSSVDRVTLVFDKPESEMTATADEIAAMKKEGVFVATNLIPSGVRGGQLLCHVSELGEPDEKTGIRPVIDTGAKDKVAADIAINACGEEVDDTLFDEIDSATYLVGDANFGKTEDIAKVIADAQRLCKKIAHSHFDKYVPDNESDDRSFLERRGKLCADCKKCAEGERCLECDTACEFCAEVCPNRANWVIKLSDGSRQILHVNDFCDGCGACSDCCPYDGEPHKEKFTLFLDEEDFKKSENDGFYVTGEANNCRFRYDGKMFKYDPINGPMGTIPDEIREMCGIVMKRFPRLLKVW